MVTEMNLVVQEMKLGSETSKLRCLREADRGEHGSSPVSFLTLGVSLGQGHFCLLYCHRGESDMQRGTDQDTLINLYRNINPQRLEGTVKKLIFS